MYIYIYVAITQVRSTFRGHVDFPGKLTSSKEIDWIHHSTPMCSYNPHKTLVFISFPSDQLITSQ